MQPADLLAAMAALCLLMAAVGAVADRLAPSERRDARSRNQAHPWRDR